MVKVLEKNSIKVGEKPVVILPLKEWEEIKETLEDLEDAVRFNIACQETRGQKGISLKELKRKYRLK